MVDQIGPIQILFIAIELVESQTAIAGGQIAGEIGFIDLDAVDAWQLRLDAIEGLVTTEPLGYLEFLKLMDNAALVVTDSGGIQEETTCLQVPCLTLRDNTERPVTIDMGTNELMTMNPTHIGSRVQQILEGDAKQGRIPPKWDGKAAVRIANILEKELKMALV